MPLGGTTWSVGTQKIHDDNAHMLSCDIAVFLAARQRMAQGIVFFSCVPCWFDVVTSLLVLQLRLTLKYVLVGKKNVVFHTSIAFFCQTITPVTGWYSSQSCWFVVVGPVVSGVRSKRFTTIFLHVSEITICRDMPFDDGLHPSSIFLFEWR